MTDRILKTAHELMADRGYSAFSYAHISDAVKIRKASIHHHFPTKAGLAVAVLRAHRERLREGTEMLDQQMENPVARLHAYVQHWEGCIRHKTEPFCVAALLAAELPGLPEEVREEVHVHFDALSAWLTRTLEAAQKEGLVHLHESAATEAQIFMAIVHGAMLSARASGSCDVFRSVTSAALKRLSTVES